MQNQAYPLKWPVGWPRTTNRQSPKFKTTLPNALHNLKRQLGFMGCENVVLSSNYTLGAETPKDPGVCAYFEWVKERWPRKSIAMAIPCDRWLRIESNVQAIALTVEAMRGMERWGAKHMIESMFLGFKQLSMSSKDWHEILDLRNGVSKEEVTLKFRELAKVHHPDKGGDPNRMAEINDAYQRAIGELS